MRSVLSWAKLNGLYNFYSCWCYSKKKNFCSFYLTDHFELLSWLEIPSGHEKHSIICLPLNKKEKRKKKNEIQNSKNILKVKVFIYFYKNLHTMDKKQKQKAKNKKIK